MDNIQVRNPKLIAKNGVYLFLRLGISLSIAFYTTRLTLYVLGDVDYGINNIVGGVIAMFAMISLPIINSLQRFFNVEFTKKEISTNTVFNTSVRLILIMVAVMLFLYETVGFFFICNVIKYPVEREFAVHVIFQISAVSSAVSFLIIPYTALLFSKENMGVPATVGIIESLYKLAMLLAIPYISVDSLIAYSTILLSIFVFELIFYIIYCKKKYPDIHISNSTDLSLGKRMLSFSGWNIIESAATISITYVSNILINIFGGILYNAAYGLAKQLNSALMAFTMNILKAVEPQITSATVVNDDKYRNQLVLSTIKITMIGMGVVFLVFHFYGNLLMQLWLKDVPQHSMVFCEMFLFTSITTSIFLPLRSLILSIGKIKWFFIGYGVISALILLITYLLLEFGVVVEVVLIMQCIHALCILSLASICINKQTTLRLSTITITLLKNIVVLIITSASFWLISSLIEENGIKSMLISACFIMPVLLISTYLIALDSTERKLIYKLVLRIKS